MSSQAIPVDGTVHARRLEGIVSWLYRFILGSSFMLALVWTYVFAIAPSLTYLGFTYFRPDNDVAALAAVLGLAPIFLLKASIDRPGDFVRWILYFGLYVPCVILPPFMGRLSNPDIERLLFALAAAFLIIAIPSGRLNIVRSGPLKIRRDFFWQCFFLAYGALNLWLLVAFGGHLRLVGFADVYAQRAASDDVLDGSLIGYASGFLSGGFNPFLMAYGLHKRRYGLFAIGAGGQVLVFATAALKSVVVSVIVIPAFYFLLFRRGGFSLTRIGLTFASSAVILALLAEELYSQRNTVAQALFSLVYMRAYCMPGVLAAVYTEFFLTHKLTFFSHVGLFRSFIHYPYGDALGHVIGGYMLPIGAPMDANASFLMTDGMAAAGFAGIVVSGVFCRIFIWLFDASVSESNIPIACCALIPVLITVMNTSLFSAMLTGGAAMLAVLLYFHSRIISNPERSDVSGTAGP